MRPCDGLGDACAGLTRVLTPPVNTILPEISGAAQPGRVLAAGFGTWLNGPTSYRVEWQHEIAGGAWQTIATGLEYVVGAGDVATRLRTLVTASNADGSAVAASGPPPRSWTRRRRRPAPAPRPAAAPRPVTAAPTPRAAGAAALRIALQSGGRQAGTVTARVSHAAGGVEVRTAAARVKARGGRWRLKLCASAPGQGRHCVLGPRGRSVRGAVRLAAARLLLRATTEPVTVTAALLDSHARPVARGTAVGR